LYQGPSARFDGRAWSCARRDNQENGDQNNCDWASGTDAGDGGAFMSRPIFVGEQNDASVKTAFANLPSIFFLWEMNILINQWYYVK
jgi:hypothetical protein